MAQAFAEMAATCEATPFDDAPPAVGPIRMLDAGWQVSARYRPAGICRPCPLTKTSAGTAPWSSHVQSVIRRGQDRGDFDPGAPRNWPIARRMTIEEAASTRASD
jgi:hypothetical protein